MGPGRISACPHGKACTEILPVCGQQSSVPVHMFPVQLGHLPSGICQVTVTTGPVTAIPAPRLGDQFQQV